MAYWLIKSEPQTYAWADLCKLGRDMWDGVRNYQARNYLRSMAVGDLALFYHSGKEKAIVGVARVVQGHYPDPTTTDKQWVVVDVVPVYALDRVVTLSQVKSISALGGMVLVKNTRLSVQPVAKADFEHIIRLGNGE